METVAVQIAYSLEDLQGDPQASMAALCQLWADDLPAEYAVKVFAVRDEFLKVHGRARPRALVTSSSWTSHKRAASSRSTWT